ncbi:MAG: N-acyl homoserine lactonase family protein [Oscillospiraceae bacterium]|nr:N-acyl homoserine lactonase family protein [Oscillospiraceae bacterium]
MIRIHILNCGSVGVDEAVPNRGVSKNALAYTGLFRARRHRITLPVKAFYIEHPKGRILVDTAWDSAVREHPIRTLTFPMWFASKPILPPGEAVDERLAALGVQPEMLDYVILTHMDIDHDSGLRLVKNAKRIMVSPDEWRAVHSAQTRYVRRPWKEIPLTQMRFSADAGAPYGLSWDVFGDGTVKVLPVPGHSQGSVAVRVCAGGTFALLVGDTGYNRASWEDLNLPGPVFDREKMKRSLAWVAAERKKPGCAAVLAAHDPEEQRSIIELEESI